MPNDLAFLLVDELANLRDHIVGVNALDVSEVVDKPADRYRGRAKQGGDIKRSRLPLLVNVNGGRPFHLVYPIECEVHSYYVRVPVRVKVIHADRIQNHVRGKTTCLWDLSHGIEHLTDCWSFAEYSECATLTRWVTG